MPDSDDLLDIEVGDTIRFVYGPNDREYEAEVTADREATNYVEVDGTGHVPYVDIIEVVEDG